MTMYQIDINELAANRESWIEVFVHDEKAIEVRATDVSGYARTFLRAVPVVPGLPFLASIELPTPGDGWHDLPGAEGLEVRALSSWSTGAVEIRTRGEA